MNELPEITELRRNSVSFCNKRSDDLDVMRLAENLKILLEKKGWRAAELARRADVPKSSVNDWLSGASPRNMGHLKSIADELGVLLDDLLFGDALAEARTSRTVNLDDLGSSWVSGIFEVRLRKVNSHRGDD